MKFGLAPIQSREHFDAMRAQARLADALGFNVLWAHEHHSGQMMYPSPLMTLAVLANETANIELGTNMLLLPLHHPLRVAEDAAMVDVMSGGRLRLGVSAGYSAADLAAFGVAQGERAKRMREGLALIRAVWSGGPVSLQGDHYRLQDFTLFPQPLRWPAPPIYVGGTVDAAIRRAARLGDELIISTTQRIGDISRMLGVYRDALIALDRPTNKAPVLNRIVHVVPDGTPKHDAVAFFGQKFLALYDAWGHQNVVGLADGARGLEQVDAEHFIIGEASACIDTIARYRELGVREIACLMNFGGPEPDAVERSMRLLAEKVMPHFHGADSA